VFKTTYKDTLIEVGVSRLRRSGRTKVGAGGWVSSLGNPRKEKRKTHGFIIPRNVICDGNERKKIEEIFTEKVTIQSNPRKGCIGSITILKGEVGGGG